DPHNILFAHHIYPASSTFIEGGTVDSWQQEIGCAFPYYPIVIEESGFASSGQSYAIYPDWNREFYNYLANGNVAKRYPAPLERGLNGLIHFLWDWVDPNSMNISAGSGTATPAQLITPTTHGKIARDHLEQPQFATDKIPVNPQDLVYPTVRHVIQA